MLNRNRLLAHTPGLIWLYGGVKLLIAASKLVSSTPLSTKVFILASAAAWGLSHLKYHFCLKHMLEAQATTNCELLSQKISQKKYLLHSFLSKRFFILCIMALFSSSLSRLGIKNHPTAHFLTLATIGYALCKTGFISIGLLYKKKQATL